MTIIISALVVMAASLAFGAVLTSAARRAARASGDEELARRVSVAGTADQRRRTLWIAVALSGTAVAAAAVGVAGIVEVLVILSLALAGQAAVLQLVASRRGGGRGSGDVAKG